MSANEFVKKLGVGWNLGDTLDAVPRGRDISPRAQETAWGNPITTREMLKTVHNAGFDIFRLPVTWSRQMGTAPDFIINEAFLRRVREIVDYGINLGMTVILNIHHEDWHFPDDATFPAAKARLERVWTQIATFFGDYSDKLIFEAMNEPRKVNTPVEWTGGDEEGRRVVMRLNQVFVDTVRATGGKNAARMLLVPNYAASCDEVAMADFVMPAGENLILSLHGYIPWDFALGGDHSKNRWTAEQQTSIDELFARIDKYFLQKNIPVIMGECGARKKHENETDRAEWALYYAAKARECGIPCCWWDNGRLEGTEKAEVFGLLNRRTLEWAFPKIVEAFVNGGKNFSFTS